ncbi:MAG TPA: hypothetical protein VMW76_04160 [Bacteroidales bacterium]|nr:hypothetical protein [Bacteroidales bacterium]
MKILKFLFLFTATAILMIACEQNKSPLSTDDINLADDDAVAEAIFDDIFSTADNATQLLDGFLKGGDVKSDIIVLADSCPMVTVDLSDELIKVITVDFGDGCTGLWDQTRSGKIIITVTGLRRQVGSTRTVTFDNYYFNGVKVEGTYVTTNEGENSNDNIVFSTELTGGKIILPNDITIEREFYREREWIAGYDTWNIWDDECLVTGGATGTTYKGYTYENTIISALHWKRVCKFFVSGVIQVNREGVDPFEIDYGDGGCDAIAVLRRGDVEKEIMLRYRHRILR